MATDERIIAFRIDGVEQVEAGAKRVKKELSDLDRAAAAAAVVSTSTSWTRFGTGINTVGGSLATLTRGVASFASVAKSGFAGAFGSVMALGTVALGTVAQGLVAVGSTALHFIGNVAVGAVRLLTTTLANAAAMASRVALGLAAVGAASAAAFARASIAAAIARDTQIRGLTSIMGSADKAAEHFREIQKVALLPGLDVQGILRFSVGLQAVGISAGLALRAARELGNINAMVGGTPETIARVGVQFQQMIGKGKVMAEDIRVVAESLPQIRQLMQSAFGTADTEALAKSGVSGAAFIEGIVAAAEKLPRATSGPMNAIINLRMAWQELLVAFGKGFTGTTGIAAIDALAEGLNRLRPQFEALGARAATVLPTLTAGLERALQPRNIDLAVTAFSGLMQILGALASSLSRLLPVVQSVFASFAAQPVRHIELVGRALIKFKEHVEWAFGRAWLAIQQFGAKFVDWAPSIIGGLSAVARVGLGTLGLLSRLLGLEAAEKELRAFSQIIGKATEDAKKYFAQGAGGAWAANIRRTHDFTGEVKALNDAHKAGLAAAGEWTMAVNANTMAVNATSAAHLTAAGAVGQHADAMTRLADLTKLLGRAPGKWEMEDYLSDPERFARNRAAGDALVNFALGKHLVSQAKAATDAAVLREEERKRAEAALTATGIGKGAVARATTEARQTFAAEQTERRRFGLPPLDKQASDARLAELVSAAVGKLKASYTTETEAKLRDLAALAAAAQKAGQDAKAKAYEAEAKALRENADLHVKLVDEYITTQRAAAQAAQEATNRQRQLFDERKRLEEEQARRLREAAVAGPEALIRSQLRLRTEFTRTAEAWAGLADEARRKGDQAAAVAFDRLAAVARRDIAERTLAAGGVLEPGGKPTVDWATGRSVIERLRGEHKEAKPEKPPLNLRVELGDVSRRATDRAVGKSDSLMAQVLGNLGASDAAIIAQGRYLSDAQTVYNAAIGAGMTIAEAAERGMNRMAKIVTDRIDQHIDRAMQEAA
jgi:tape measure domain-containing protein